MSGDYAKASAFKVTVAFAFTGQARPQYLSALTRSEFVCEQNLKMIELRNEGPNADLIFCEFHWKLRSHLGSAEPIRANADCFIGTCLAVKVPYQLQNGTAEWRHWI
jgi:hypothetical protein